MTPTSVEQTEQQTCLNVSILVECASSPSNPSFPLFLFLDLEVFCFKTLSFPILQFTTNTALYWVKYFSCLQEAQSYQLPTNIPMNKNKSTFIYFI